MTKKDKILRDIFDYHSRYGETKEQNAFIKFWQKSYNHFNIIMLLGSVANEETGIAYEKICDVYASKFAGRTTILSILNEGCENSFFVKAESTEDHRMQNYKLQGERKKDVTLWLENHPIRNL